MANNKSVVSDSDFVWFGLLGAALLAAGAADAKRRTPAADPAAALVREVLAEAAAALGVRTPHLELVLGPGQVNADANRLRVRVNLLWFRGVLARHCGDPSCQRAMALGILAHELGHHLDPDLGTSADPWPAELRADFVSGWVLARWGAPVDACDRLLLELGDGWGSATHPPAARRVDAVRDGYFAAVGRARGTGAGSPRAWA